MARPRVLAIGLDGLEITLAEKLMDSGEMPSLAELRRRSARFRLDHGPAQRTGLAWEHVASGRSPDAARRWAAVEFDPRTYAAWQEGARFAPWWTDTDLQVLVFDTPYVNLLRPGKTRGIVAWGAHDPGAVNASQPSALKGEFEGRFGRYPASRWTYGTPWPSPERTRTMGEALVQALDLRSRAAQWLGWQRFPDWDMFFAVVGELHGTVEGLWHGIDPTHPLHEHPSAAPAGRALLDVHRALDRLVGDLVRAAGDATIVAFTMGGMGPNHSDVQSMVLLPELLYRHAFGRPLLSVPSSWAESPMKLPILDEKDSWAAASASWVPGFAPVSDERPGVLRELAQRLPAPIKNVLKEARTAVAGWRSPDADEQNGSQELDWQPALRYQDHWPRMPAFALPSFYDGRIRINLRGRERDGMVDPARYEETCHALETLLGDCRDPRTGVPSVQATERASTRDPLALTSSEADLIVIWRNAAAALEHPTLGLVGPVPFRRTGGHTGPYGMAYVAGADLQAGDRGVRSAFDVVPGIVDLLGRPPLPGVDGTSLIARSA
jgi:predicted AlkP superfamily phosphohydrolase/phosphomutase